MTERLLTLAICLSAFAATPAFASSVLIVGSPADQGSGNIFPFGDYSGEYQQVYDHGQFPGAITITGLEFFNTQYDSGATSAAAGSWIISLSTTSADWNTLSSTFAANVGANNTQVFNGNISQPWVFGDILKITFSTPFTYDPGQGNLLMDVVAQGTGFPTIVFDANGWNGGGENGNTFMGRVRFIDPATGLSNGVDSGYGLVTGFITTAPEPSCFIMVAAGLGLAGMMSMRRRPM